MVGPDVTSQRCTNDSFVYCQDLSEYGGVSNIEQGFHGKPTLKKHYKTSILTSTSSSHPMRHFTRKCILAVPIIFKMETLKPS